MHPELYLTIYRQQERELERRLLHRLRAQERTAAPRSTRRTATASRLGGVSTWFAALTARSQPTGSDLACCTA